MSWAIVWARPAQKDLRRLDASMERWVIAAMSRFAETGQGDVKRLVDRGAELRLRVGDWRVRFRFDRDAGCIYVIHVKHRSEAYDD